MSNLLNRGAVLLILNGLSAAFGSSETALETFKSLKGTWAIQSEGKTLSIKMTYEVGSNGSIVTEQFGKELSVIYRDGQSLLMTHFCNRGNQPRLRLKESSRPGVLEFETFDITNLKSADTAHVERVVYTIVDEKRVELEIVWTGDQSEKYIFTKP